MCSSQRLLLLSCILPPKCSQDNRMSLHFRRQLLILLWSSQSPWEALRPLTIPAQRIMTLGVCSHLWFCQCPACLSWRLQSLDSPQISLTLCQSPLAAFCSANPAQLTALTSFTTHPAGFNLTTGRRKGRKLACMYVHINLFMGKCSLQRPVFISMCLPLSVFRSRWML